MCVCLSIFERLTKISFYMYPSKHLCAYMLSTLFSSNGLDVCAYCSLFNEKLSTFFIYLFVFKNHYKKKGGGREQIIVSSCEPISIELTTFFVTRCRKDVCGLQRSLPSFEDYFSFCS